MLFTNGVGGPGGPALSVIMDLVLDKEFEVLLTGGPQGGGCSEERSGPEIRIQGFLQENGGQAVCREEEGRWLSVTPRPALKAPGRGVSQQRRLRRRPRTAPRHSRDEGENRTKDATCSTMGCVNSFESCQEIRQDASYGTRPQRAFSCILTAAVLGGAAGGTLCPGSPLSRGDKPEAEALAERQVAAALCEVTSQAEGRLPAPGTSCPPLEGPPTQGRHPVAETWERLPVGIPLSVEGGPPANRGH
ncbi:unnamed protein product [Rangifer tarandus platyrhynchus]|uniref:Uncharacterized protein n=1 Tax=Rangifer tarandus platyrhynchus TaxID=3082113 RepID=A0AC59YPT5_RANTA